MGALIFPPLRRAEELEAALRAEKEAAARAAAEFDASLAADREAATQASSATCSGL